MLFADNNEPSTGTLVIVIGMTVTAIGAAVAAVLNYMTARDKLQFDSEARELRKAVLDCAKERTEYREQIDKLHARAEESDKTAEKAERVSAQQEGELTATRREVTELRQEVRELRDRLYGGVKP